MNIEKFKVLEEVKLCYLKHRGNCLEIAKELKLPLDYVRKQVHKFQKQEDRAVSVLIANNLMSHILLGSQSRNTYLMEMLRSLEQTEKPSVSTCCNKPIKQVPPENPEDSIRWRCMSCQAICDIHQPPKATIYNIKSRLLDQLREEDLGLVEMAEKMGYTNKVEAPTTIINNKPNVLVLSGTSAQDKQVIEDYSNLSMMDKERLIEKLRKQITNPDVSEPFSEEPPVTPSTNPLP